MSLIFLLESIFESFGVLKEQGMSEYIYYVMGRTRQKICQEYLRQLKAREGSSTKAAIVESLCDQGRYKEVVDRHLR